MVNLKKFLLGDALKDDQLKNQKLSRLWGLPIMASDAVSSVAYAVEEIFDCPYAKYFLEAVKLRYAI